MYKTILIIIFVLVNTFLLKAQTAFSSTSHSATINGITYEYAIGEMVLINTQKTSTVIVTQGFLQPQNNKAPLSTSDAAVTLSAIKVYPNPSDDIVFIESDDEWEGSYQYQLFDATGKVLISKQGTQQIGINSVQLDVKPYASGSYYLLISKPNAVHEQQKYSFKIQKK